MIKISHIKKETDGIVSDEVYFTVPDVRYPMAGSVEIQMTLKDANLFLAELSKKLSNIPF